MPSNLRAVDGVRLTWGESLRWDDRRQRLWFVDCAANALHWLDGGTASSMALPSLPTGVALTEGDEVVVCLDDGLHVVDADAGTSSLLAPYPPELGGRANDAAATEDGALLTGTLNLAPGPGVAVRWSADAGWSVVDEEVGNFNGPVSAGGRTFYGDTLAGVVYERTGGGRVVFGDHAPLGGAPDGAAPDAGGGVWSCSVRAGKVVRFTDGGVDRVLEVGARNPSDVCFGGPDLDRLYVVSIALDLAGTGEVGDDAGKLLVVDDLGVRGLPEPRLRL